MTEAFFSPIRKVWISATVCLLLLPFAARSQDVASFYAGKTIKLMVGGGAGGPHDLYSRTMAKYMEAHIPGKPNIILEYRPGAGGARGANHLYNVAPRDGTSFGLLLQGVTNAQILGGAGIKYDISKMHWIGGLDETNSTLTVWHTAPATTIDGARKVQVILGSTGKASETYIHPIVMNAFLGTKFKCVIGFRGFAPMDRAMENGELHGHTGTWNSWKTVRAGWVKAGKVKHLVQIGLKKDPDLPDVPLLVDLATNDDMKGIFQFVSASGVFGRAYIAPPGVPADRLAALRGAFEATTRDPGFISEAKRRKMDLNPVPWQRLDATARQVLGTPAQRIAKIKALLK